MKKVVLIIFSIFFFLAAAHNAHAQTPSPFDLLRDLLKIIFSFQNLPSIPPPDITPPSGDSSLDRYFPSPLDPVSPKLTDFDRNSVLTCLNRRTLYEQAASSTGLAWQILAGIHYLEARCTDRSLVSGRPIGANEPDVVRGGGCSTGLRGPGIPIPLPGGGCGFATLLDTAIYAARHIQGKIGKNPDNFEELVKAFGRYNGTGNANCGRTPYTNCPPYFEGEDHIYPMNWFDSRHGTMYLVYCADRVKCNPPQLYQRPGALTVLRILEGK